jgi:hypothetical protein
MSERIQLLLLGPCRLMIRSLALLTFLKLNEKADINISNAILQCHHVNSTMDFCFCFRYFFE